MTLAGQTIFKKPSRDVIKETARIFLEENAEKLASIRNEKVERNEIRKAKTIAKNAKIAEREKRRKAAEKIKKLERVK